MARNDLLPIEEGPEGQVMSCPCFWLSAVGPGSVGSGACVTQVTQERLSGPGALQPQRKGLVWACSTVVSDLRAHLCPCPYLCVSHHEHSTGKLGRAFLTLLLGRAAPCCQRHDEGGKNQSCPLMSSQLPWPWARVTVGQLSPFLVRYPTHGQELCVEVTPR